MQRWRVMWNWNWVLHWEINEILFNWSILLPYVYWPGHVCRGIREFFFILCFRFTIWFQSSEQLFWRFSRPLSWLEMERGRKWRATGIVKCRKPLRTFVFSFLSLDCFYSPTLPQLATRRTTHALIPTPLVIMISDTPPLPCPSRLHHFQYISSCSMWANSNEG